MHNDMNPLWPLADGNSLSGPIGTGPLHIGLALAGFFGAIRRLLLNQSQRGLGSFVFFCHVIKPVLPSHVSSKRTLVSSTPDQRRTTASCLVPVTNLWNFRRLTVTCSTWTLSSTPGNVTSSPGGAVITSAGKLPFTAVIRVAGINKW